jgi:hypothetical protein
LLQGSDLFAALRADAVTRKLHGIGVHFAAEVAAPRGAVFFEDDLITLHEDFELRIRFQLHAGPKLLWQDNTPKVVDAAYDSGTFHVMCFSFDILHLYLRRRGSSFSIFFRATMPGVNPPQENCASVVRPVYKIYPASSMIAVGFDKNFFLFLEKPPVFPVSRCRWAE